MFYRLVFPGTKHTLFKALATIKIMKINSLVLLFCLLQVFTVAAFQAEEEQNYKKYHQRINEAERLISEEKYTEALDAYDNLFQGYDFVFLRDYKIAAQLAVHLNKKEKAFDLIKEGMAAGWELKTIKKDKYFSQLLEEPDWEVIEKSYPDLRSEYLARIDHPIRAKVRKMFKKDQRKALGALFRIGDKARERYATNKFAPHSEIQLNELIMILDNHGYPGERLIGNDVWMSTIISHHNSISREYAIQDTLYNYIKPMLRHAMEQGQLSPYEYAMIDDWQIAVSSDRTEAGYGFLNPPNQSTLFETNELRQKIGLRSVELRNKLIEVEQGTGMNFYLPDWVEGKIRMEQK